MRRSTTAVTAPSSSTSRPRVRAACASHSRRVEARRPVAANHVPTSWPASACAACAADVRTTGMPEPAAIATDSSLVTMPPVPTALPRAEMSIPSRSWGPFTVAMRVDPARDGGPV